VAQDGGLDVHGFVLVCLHAFYAQTYLYLTVFLGYVDGRPSCCQA
jgi:hypothetical protein